MVARLVWDQEVASSTLAIQTMRKLLVQHSLSISLFVLMIVFLVLAIINGVEAADIYSNIFGDSFGAFIIVTLTKWLHEKGSSQSK